MDRKDVVKTVVCLGLVCAHAAVFAAPGYHVAQGAQPVLLLAVGAPCSLLAGLVRPRAGTLALPLIPAVAIAVWASVTVPFTDPGPLDAVIVAGLFAVVSAGAVALGLVVGWFGRGRSTRH